MARLGLSDVRVIRKEELIGIPAKTIIIFDEYHDALMDEKFSIRANRKLNPLFLLGTKGYGQLIAVSGHNSIEFTDFMRDYFANKVRFCINKSISEMYGGDPQAYRVSLQAC